MWITYESGLGDNPFDFDTDLDRLEWMVIMLFTQKDIKEKQREILLMNTCIKCDGDDDYRLHLGYKNVPIVVKQKSIPS